MSQFGGITDGTFVCGLCGEWRTGCSLCFEAPLVDMREAQRKQRSEEMEADAELSRQERAIRRAADRGEL